MAEGRLRDVASEELTRFARALTEAWGHFAQQWKVWVAAACLNLIVSASIVVAGLLAWPLLKLDGYEVLLAVTALLGLFTGGLCRMAIRQLRGEAISVGHAFTFGPEFLYLMGASVMLLLIVPPALVFGGARNLLLTFPLIVDRRISIGDALSESWQTLSRARQPWNAMGFFAIFLALGAVSVGSLALVVGFPVTVPLFWLWVAGVYRECYACPTSGEE